jgi:hypothetical protein
MIQRQEGLMTYDFLRNEQALAEFIGRFEQGTLPKPIWTHAAHLAVGTWYLVTLPEEIAVEQVRTGIRHYNDCVGTANTPDSGYHETLTMFWLKTIAQFLRNQEGVEKLEAVRSVVEEFGGRRDLLKKYYSFDVVASREARAGWIAPDRIVQQAGNKSTLRYI